MTDGHLSCPSEKSESGVYYSYVYFFKLYVYSTFCFVLVFFCLFIKKGNVDVFLASKGFFAFQLIRIVIGFYV